MMRQNNEKADRTKLHFSLNFHNKYTLELFYAKKKPDAGCLFIIYNKKYHSGAKKGKTQV